MAQGYRSFSDGRRFYDDRNESRGRSSAVLALAVLGIWVVAAFAVARGEAPALQVFGLAVVAAAVQLWVSHRADGLASVGARALGASQLWFASVCALGAAVLTRRLFLMDLGLLGLVVGALVSGLACAGVQEVAVARAGRQRSRAAIIGTGEEAAEWIELLDAQSEMGIDVIGCVGDETSAKRVGIADRWLGDTNDAVDILELEGIDLAIVSVASFRRPTLHDLVERLLAAGHDVGMSWGVGRLSNARLASRTFGHETLPVIRVHRPSNLSLRIKRVIDVSLASLLLLISAPVLLVAAAAVRLESEGSAFFRQRRVGLDGEVFDIIKVRTMTEHAADEVSALNGENERTGPLFKMTDDPRVTRSGRILRKFSIDEMPQLLNVLRGEMSLVGPRPALPEETEQFDDELLARANVRPGITGLWQLEARSNRSFHAYKRLDLHYLENWSVGLDLRIMMATAQMLVIGALVAPITRRLSAATPDKRQQRFTARIASEDIDVAAADQVVPSDVAVLGAGYVGLTQALGLCKLGHRVVCADINEERVSKLIAGEPPILEEGLKELLDESNQSGRLVFSSDPVAAAAEADFIFLCVATPQREDGAADLCYLEAAATQIGPSLRPGAVVINKSTVPVGSVGTVAERLGRVDVAVISNPEFLREGTAIADWFAPDRILVGGELHAAHAVMDLYASLPGERIICDARSAELIKYANNAYLATRLTFVNSISTICEAVGADAQHVTTAMGLDARIGPRYLQPGPGWGGSCLPKDTHALAYQADQAGVSFTQLRATIAANDDHLERCVSTILDSAEHGKAKVVGVLGIAFKAGTGDTRQSPALKIIQRLVDAGVEVQCHDPGVTEAPMLGIELVANTIDCAKGADVLAVLTEWPEFATLDLEKIHEVMRTPNVVDLRNLLDAEELKDLGFSYREIGVRPTEVAPSSSAIHFDEQQLADERVLRLDLVDQ